MWQARRTGALLLVIGGLIGACSSADVSSPLSSPLNAETPQGTISVKQDAIPDSNLCAVIDALFRSVKYGQYGLNIDTCTSGVADDGDDMFFLRFNDPAEWNNLVVALGDIPVKEAAWYAFWEIPLSLLSMGFYEAKETPNNFDQILVSFANKKETVYNILPRDVAYVIDVPESKSKEEFSTIVTMRIKEISERIEVYNLNE